MTIRLIATDIDGTLLRSDDSLSPRTHTAIAAARARGIVLVFATGRPPRWMGPIADALDHDGLAVLSNGAIRYSLADNTVIDADVVPSDVTETIVTDVRSAVPGVMVAAESVTGYAWLEPYRSPYWTPPESGRRHTVAELAADPPVKILMRHPDHDEQALHAIVAPLVEGRATATYSGYDGLVEISAPGVTKASGLAKVCATLSITADEVIAFGDMPNDVEMLRWAGRSVAMGNAHPDVVAAAAERTLTNDEDGVAVVIEQLLADAG